MRHKLVSVITNQIKNIHQTLLITFNKKFRICQRKQHQNILIFNPNLIISLFKYLYNSRNLLIKWIQH